MKEKIYNAINDPNVTFFLCPTAALKEAIIKGEHEYVKALTADAKSALLEGKVLPVGKDDVLDLIEGRLKADRYWLMTTGEIRVGGATQVIANTIAQKKVQEK
jgi:hypothetical protein